MVKFETGSIEFDYNFVYLLEVIERRPYNKFK